ncbi:MAG: hypothetical protein AAGA43_07770 [Bacteroidota bacterium]
MKSFFVLLLSSLILMSCSSSDSSSGEEDIPDVSIPTLTTNAITGIDANSATSGGNVTNNGGGALLQIGLCWDTNPNPTIADNRTEEDTNDANFTSTMNSLNPNTLYYVRAYASNSAGVGYGNQQSFTTLDQ